MANALGEPCQTRRIEVDAGRAEISKKSRHVAPGSFDQWPIGEELQHRTPCIRAGDIGTTKDSARLEQTDGEAKQSRRGFLGQVIEQPTDDDQVEGLRSAKEPNTAERVSHVTFEPLDPSRKARNGKLEGCTVDVAEHDAEVRKLLHAQKR